MKLRAWLKKRKMLIKEFSDITGFNKSSFYLWMSGKRIPSKKAIEKISVKTGGEIKSLEDIQD